MSAPFIWIFLPAGAGVVLLLLNQRIRWAEIAGASLVALLALAALRLPVGGALTIRSLVIAIDPDMTVLGRQFIIRPDMLGIISAVYASAFLWFLLAAVMKPGRFFVPLGLVAIALLMSAVTFNPWEFVGLFILFSVLVLVVFLSPPGETASQSVLNFLSFSAMGVPFLLIAGALISGLSSTPPGLPIVARPAIFLGVGFVFLLALFPFHAWMPRLGEEIEPLAAAFVFVFLPAFVCILLLQLIDRNVWLRNSQEVFTLLRSIGIVTVVAGGIFSAFQRNLGRIMGFASLVQTGLFLLAIGAGPRESAALFFPLLVGRSLGFLAFAAGSSWLRDISGDLQFRSIQGAGRKFPVPAAVAALGMLSLGGLPLLAGYIPIIRLYAALASSAPSAAVGLWIGVFGLLFAALRSIAVLVMLPEGETIPGPRLSVNFAASFRNYALIGTAFLLIIGGLIPSWVEPVIKLLPLAFDHLRP